MGVLYSSVMLRQNMKRQFVLEKLKEKGITHNENGTSIEDLDYETLKYLLVIQAFKDIDAEGDSSKWF